MSDNDVEFVHIDLDDISDSADEFVEPARNKRQRESRKRFVKRKRQDLIESDDESTKKRVQRRNKRSSDSDFEPTSKSGIRKKSKDSLDSDEDSSKKPVREKPKSSVNSPREPKKKKTATQSESLDSDDERARSSSVVASKVVVPLTRVKVTFTQERASADKADDADGSGNIPDKGDKGLDSSTETCKSFSIVVSNVAAPKSRKKITPMRERTSARESSSPDEDTDEASDGADIHDESTSCVDSDGEKPKSSSVKTSKNAPARKRLPEDEANADEADDGGGIPDESNSCPNSDDEAPVSVTEERSCSSEKPTVKLRRVEALSRDRVRQSEANAADGAGDDFTRVPAKSSFELGYNKAEKIVGASHFGVDGIKFLVQFRGRENPKFVSNEKCKKICPELLFQFYEKNIKWTNAE